jgi:hypothetical protein
MVLFRAFFHAYQTNSLIGHPIVLSHLCISTGNFGLVNAGKPAQRSNLRKQAAELIQPHLHDFSQKRYKLRFSATPESKL